MDYIQEIILEEYKSFHGKHTLYPAIPNGEIGSGLTVIFGENNSGKTSFLETLKFYDGKTIDSSSLHGKKHFILTTKSIRGGISKLENEADNSILYGSVREFQSISSPRSWYSTVNSTESLDGTFHASIRKDLRDNNISNFSAVLKDLEKPENVNTKKLFLSSIKKVYPNFINWRTLQQGQQTSIHYVYDNKSNTHTTEHLGEGFKSVMRIIGHLFAEQQHITLIIDEPELALHPSAQKELAKVIAEASKVRQIIVATHSPYFIDGEYFRNGAKYVRFNKTKEKSEIKILKDHSNYRKLFDFASWNQPYSFDEVAKEVFFYENVLFLEGQEDVGLFKKFIKDKNISINFNIFGYGVRGCGQFDAALELARDLGIKKAAIVIDNGEEEIAILNRLKEKYEADGYLFEQLLTNDIRDKQYCHGCSDENCKTCGYNRKKREGYFDKDGNIKPEYETIMTELLERIIKYFK